MKRLALLPLLCLAATLFAADAPLLNQTGKALTEPDLMRPLGPEWSVAKGIWTPAEGVLSSTEVPEEKHIPVLHLATGPTAIVWECDFRLQTGKTFLIGCDSQAKHCARLVVTPKSAKLCEDSTEVKGQVPSHTLTETVLALKPDEWTHVRVEYAGDRLAARLGMNELRVQHPYLATPKARWWFAASTGVQIRNIHVSEGTPLAGGAATSAK